ncbi:MAG TPA: glycosyltransferase family 1 protein, partial [bacterium]|nr:glycosyltransferase family 1 protein [bacterium]
GNPFLYYVASPFESWLSADDIWPRYARAPQALTAVTLYDLIPLRFAEQYLSSDSERESYLARLDLIRNADLVLAISESSARDGIELLDLNPKRIVTIGAGVSEFWQPAADRRVALDALRQLFPALRPGFVFYAGGINFRKNMEGLLRGYATVPREIRKKHQLVLTCKMGRDEEKLLSGLAQSLQISADALFTNYVSDPVLRNLYQTTDLFVFPSLYEGFGLPLVEAMACGAPSITADRSSMREIVDWPEARFNPDTPESIGEAIASTLSNDARLQKLRTSCSGIHDRFSWKKVARRAIDACCHARENAIRARRSRSVSRRRPTFAFFSPMPPEPSGIADYSMRLVRALEPFADVDVFVEDI